MILSTHLIFKLLFNYKIETMKNLIFVLAGILISFAIAAQNATVTNQLDWSIGIEPSLPVGHFTKYTSFGVGGSVQGEYKPSQVGITLNAGYMDFFGKTTGGISYLDFKYIPVLAGIKYYFSTKSYVHGQAGAGLGTNGLGTSFWYGLGTGLYLSKFVDAELKYTGWNQKVISGSSYSYLYLAGGHYSTIGLRLAYHFK